MQDVKQSQLVQGLGRATLDEWKSREPALLKALVRVEGNVRSERLGDRPQHAWEYGALYVL